MKPLSLLFLLSIGWVCSQVQAAWISLSDYKRILFIGDSIAHAGHYVSYIETWLRQNDRGLPNLIQQIGLPSETCTGLADSCRGGCALQESWLQVRASVFFV